MKEKREGERQDHENGGGELSVSNHQLYSGTVQKVLLYSCVHFLLTIINGEAGIWMQSAWVTPVTPQDAK